QEVRVFSASGTWHKPPGLVHVRIILTGAGGHGSANTSNGSGGGGGAAVESDRILASALPDTAPVRVGVSNSLNEREVGASEFLDYRAPGGQVASSWKSPGGGGLAPWRGGNGGGPGESGESVSLLP